MCVGEGYVYLCIYIYINTLHAILLRDYNKLYLIIILSAQ